MPANAPTITNRWEIALLRVTAHLRRRPSAKAQFLAGWITEQRRAIPGKVAASRNEGRGTKIVEAEGRLIRVTPAAGDALVTMWLLLTLIDGVDRLLSEVPGGADLRPLLYPPPRPRRGGPLREERTPRAL